MVENQVNSSNNQQVNVEYRLQKNREEMKYQFISFIFMILLSAAAFVAVATEGFHSLFVIPLILLLACVQVGFQLYYFMHMSQKGHAQPALFLYSGISVAFVTIVAFATIIWW